MKLMIASDIHGSAYYCERLVEAFRRERPAKLVLLGDILYHGPRNDLPREYDPKRVIALLSEIKENIVCVKGNCDAYVDDMVLPFAVVSDFALLLAGERTVYATHGHLAGEDTPPTLAEGDVLLCGHTHVPACCQKEGYLYVNCGSVSIPKENSPHSYLLLEEGAFTWMDLESGEPFSV